LVYGVIFRQCSEVILNLNLNFGHDHAFLPLLCPKLARLRTRPPFFRLALSEASPTSDTSTLFLPYFVRSYLELKLRTWPRLFAFSLSEVSPTSDTSTLFLPYFVRSYLELKLRTWPRLFAFSLSEVSQTSDTSTLFSPCFIRS
jgi:hypothetical protein